MKSLKPSHGSSSSSAARAFSARPPEVVGGKRLEERLLGGEVAVDRADPDPRRGRDLVHLGLGAVLGEASTRRIEHPLAVAPRVGARPALERIGGLRDALALICDIGKGQKAVTGPGHLTNGTPIPYSVEPEPELRFRLYAGPGL